MVEVCKTDVQLPEQAVILAGKLSAKFPRIKINFDLEDCDRVLRVEGEQFVPNKIIEMVASNGYYCQVME
ncbi:MAG TPA: hypothetical protein VK808_03710 [Bacteroidia bacterium]|jgi:hypothetical protein|nr:hypothetical protein [Bacteroidia bacterium]